VLPVTSSCVANKGTVREGGVHLVEYETIREQQSPRQNHSLTKFITSCSIGGKKAALAKKMKFPQGLAPMLALLVGTVNAQTTQEIIMYGAAQPSLVAYACCAP